MSWAPSDWARIEKIARAECALRADLAGRMVGGLELLSLVAQQHSHALELRQWAAMAGAAPAARRSYRA